ncbi:hypothetical protein KI387_010270 [Taxus chinensis]|uniref:L-arabinokinase n=1 Tax=Taxus chinensis TaxID=29808 RepID=A0AA38FL76_TAXCH|nr:hypothetical protein KI387_010270 [Taxus chinensis]
MIRRDLLTGHWIPYLERAVKLNPCYDQPINGGEYSGARRLRDAIVLGFQLQRIPGRDISIPEWYSHAENELGLRPMMPDGKKNEHNLTSVDELGVEDFEILHGDLHGFSDTMTFLKSLASLDFDFSSNEITEKRLVRERLAAAGLFNWEDEIFVARAPGRLDVMGGIADYSGSLVLQMPIREACHVAVQRSHPSKQRLWKHALARQHARGEGFCPVVQIVSYGSELSNRAPTFDMDIADFEDADGPISYEKANKYFAQDPSQNWAAYVAGTILVLIRELGVQFNDGISILVSSGVPEGKGVSSSAAIEVATMSAIAAAHGIHYRCFTKEKEFLSMSNTLHISSESEELPRSAPVLKKSGQVRRKRIIQTKIDKAMAKRDEKESTMESCIASKLADIGDTDLGPEPLSDLIDRSRAGKTSLMRAVKSSGIIRAAAFPCTAQLPEFVMECARSYHPSSRSVRDAAGKTIIRLDAEFINYCLKIPVRKVVTSISIQDADSRWEKHRADCVSIMNSRYMKKPRSPSKFPRTLLRSNLVQEVDDVVKLLCRINGKANAYTFRTWMYAFIRTIEINKVDSIINWSEIISNNIGEQLRNVKRTFSFKMTSYLVYAAASQGVFSKLDRCGVLSKDPIFECYPQLTAPACEKDFKVINDDFFYDFICRLDKDLKANRVSKEAWEASVQDWQSIHSICRFHIPQGYGLFWRTNKDAQVSE